MTLVFWLSVQGIFYAYFGYPGALSVLTLFNKKEVKSRDDYLPMVTLIITVHNEERRIRKKIQNTLGLDYPSGKLEIIFSSDFSTDATEEIISQYVSDRIKVMRSPFRGGKEVAQKCAIEKASGEILVFTDVGTMLKRDAVRMIVSNFADESVGCVSSKDRVVDEHGKVSGEGAYVRYEMWLRALETQVNSVVGLSGSFFAARKNVCLDWPTNIPSDFNTLLNSIRAGLRGISDPESIGLYATVKDKNLEFERKVRTITRGISGFMANTSILNPARYGLFSWQLASHKLMRWLVPWFMIAALCMNILLGTRRLFYSVLLSGQCVFYLLAYIGSRRQAGSILYMVPYFFVQANLAILMAWVKYFKGERYVSWTPSRRL